MSKSLGGYRIKSTLTPREITYLRGDGRSLPAALACCSCGSPVGKELLKFAVIERLTLNRDLSEKERLEIVRALFPEDTYNPEPVG